MRIRMNELRRVIRGEVKRLVEVGEHPRSWMRPRPCFRCNTTEDVTYGPDPYDADVNNDSTPVWECGRCRAESAGDI